MTTPFDEGYQPLKPLGKYVLIEVFQEQPEEKKVGHIIVPAAQRVNPQYAQVLDVGSEVKINVAKDDFIEVNAQLYPNITDKEGYGKYQLVHEEQIAGVYKKK